ncbi:MAG: hypothetical protein JO051_13335 [Acidobacteriaceae bacterium]|nr:hypothetical protein [Acidobacteriaceae bacterium]
MLALFLLLSVAPDQNEILQHVKANVEAELALASNYTCALTIERNYLTQKQACVAGAQHGKPQEYMRDRLRLDVAVSEGREIFSWHGESHFTSSNVSDVIRNGPRTSGQFVGFLRNIFLNSGVQFTFKGASREKGRATYSYDYVVQQSRSTYFLKGRAGGSIVPFHGTFSVEASTLELVRLTIIGDDIPASSGICSAETDLDYQLVRISSRQALLPSSFVLKIQSDPDVYTVNRNEYTQCREFRGESTLLFTPENSAAPVETHAVVDQPLPAGLTLKASLDNPIDDKISYMGDAVDATLAEPLTVPGSNKTIPAGAALHGVISQMEEHVEGLEYWLFGIKFERLNSGQDSYVLNAWPLPAGYQNIGSKFGSDRVLTDQTAQAAQHGFWFMDGSHFKLPRRFTRYWRTQDLPNDNPAAPETGARYY